MIQDFNNYARSRFMSLSNKDLAFIQKAGQAAHSAAESIGQIVRVQGEALIANLTTQPFSTGADQIIERFKSISSLSQGLIAVEAQLQRLYALANELASPDVIILPTLAHAKSSESGSVVDVVAKPAQASKKAKRAKRVVAKAVNAGGLTANDSKLLAYLKGILQSDSATSITGASMAKGAKLPLGSVGISLKRVIALGAVKMVGRGSYQLAESAVEASASKPEKPKVKARPKVAQAAKAKKVVAKVVEEKPVRKPKIAKKKTTAAGAADTTASSAE